MSTPYIELPSIGFKKLTPGATDLSPKWGVLYCPADTVVTLLDWYGNTEADVTLFKGYHPISPRQVIASTGDIYYCHNNDKF